MRITVALLSALLLSAQPPQPNTPAAPSAKPGSVEGVVTNSVTGEPVKKALIRLQGFQHRSNYQTTTDTAGVFRFDRVDPGTYFVLPTHDGFQIETASNGRPQSITVAEEKDTTDVKVQLIPLARVSGHVLDEDGDPIMLAGVEAWMPIYNQGRKQLMTVGFANSNDLGEFQFINLPPGRYYFLANAQHRTPNLPPRTHFSGQQTGFQTIYYPGGANLSQATASNIAPGADITNLDFRLPKIPAFHVRGKVVDEAGPPARDTLLELDAQETGIYPRIASVSIQADGSFDLAAVVPGSYYVVARRVNPDKFEFARETITVSDQDVNGVLITLSSGVTISGRFTIEGQPPTQFNGQVLLRTEAGPGQDFNGQLQADGTFVLHDASPGTYFVDVFNGTAGLYVKSVHFGDTDVTNGLLTLSPGSTAALNVVLGADGGQVQGTAQTSAGEPAANISVTLAPAADMPGRLDLIKQTNTDANGAFHFQDVAPGDYKVFAWELNNGLDQIYELRNALSSHAASVTIAPNGRESVTVQMISAGEAETEKNKLQ